MNVAQMQTTIEERRGRLKNWLQTVRDNVTEGAINHHIFWEVQAIIRDNPLLQNTASAFYDLMASTFVHSTVIAIRRQLDTDNRCISLHRLLLELKEFPGLISREYHRSLYCGPEFGAEFGDSLASNTYDTSVGKDATTLDVRAIQLEIDSLTAASKKIHHYADRVVAHYDARGLERNSPKFDDLTECLTVIEKLVLRYESLLNGVSLTSLLPTFQYDWKSVFRIAWIPPR
jgi:hypothetical protein